MGLFLSAAVAADINGKWTAQVPGRGGQNMETTFTFKADGDKLTGSVTTPRGDAPISDGKISGDEFSFTQVMNFNGNEMKLLYKGKMTGDDLKMTRQREGSEPREFTAKRAS